MEETKIDPIVKLVLYKKHFMTLTYGILSFLKKERENELKELEIMQQTKLPVEEIETKIGGNSCFNYDTLPVVISKFHIREYARILKRPGIMEVIDRRPKQSIFVIKWLKFWDTFSPFEEDLKERLINLGVVTEDSLDSITALPPYEKVEQTTTEQK